VESNQREETSPQVSVIIPAFNASNYIERAIESALNQTYTPLEVIVVDDGSTDNTTELARRYPVRIVRQSNQGPAAARNHGARIARGGWFAFLDADDSWSPDKLEKQVTLTSIDNVGIIQTRTSGVYDGGVPDEIEWHRLWTANCIATSAVMIRREAFEECEGFPNDLSPVEDYYLWLRVSACGWRILTYPEVLTYYTPTPTSISRDERQMLLSLLRCFDRIATRSKLTGTEIKARKRSAYILHGRGLIHRRRLSEARSVLRKALLSVGGGEVFLLCAIAHLPGHLLDLRRHLQH